MKTTTHTLALLMSLTAAATTVACSSASSGSGTGGSNQSGSGGSGSGSGGSSAMTVDLVPDSTGWVDEMSNTLGIQGAWYGYGDAYGPTTCGDAKLNGSKCTDPNAGNHMMSECSRIDNPPVPAQEGVGFPNEGGKMCTKGQIAKVITSLG